MSDNCYNYIKEELEDGTIGYLFLTDTNIIYNVSFDISLYSTYLSSYPFLLQRGYGLGFFPQFGERCKQKGFDEKISATIEDISLDFISSFNDDIFILYHCESMDGKQAGRYRLFNKWFGKSQHNDKMYKHGLEVEIKQSEDETVYHYIGFITTASNKYIENAIIELEEFSVDLINENVNKNGGSY